jgi:hypothetical protein
METIDNVKVMTFGTQELGSALGEMGTMVALGNGRTFYFLPYWFEKVEGHLVIHKLDNAPPELAEYIQKEREGE